MIELTVIIPFLNEGDEIEKTIIEIRRTAGSNVDILLVNDASTDDFNYIGIAAKYNVLYIENYERLGSAASRDIGVLHCKTPFFLTIDGHMRFYMDQWWEKILIELKKNERAIYCCRCKPWSYETGVEDSWPAAYGAYIRLDKYCGDSILNVEWINYDLYPNENIVDIPCILGACYSASTRYWKHLRGNDKLALYGCDEQNISIKAWMEGGKCCLIKNVVIGHLFRKSMPYPHKHEHILFNKAIIIETLFPDNLKYDAFKQLTIDSGIICSRCRLSEINDLRNYYKENNIADFNRFIDFNNEVITLIHSKYMFN